GPGSGPGRRFLADRRDERSGDREGLAAGGPWIGSAPIRSHRASRAARAPLPGDSGGHRSHADEWAVRGGAVRGPQPLHPPLRRTARSMAPGRGTGYADRAGAGATSRHVAGTGNGGLNNEPDGLLTQFDDWFTDNRTSRDGYGPPMTPRDGTRGHKRRARRLS